MAADFDVRAQLTLDSRVASSGLARFSSGMDHLGRQLASGQSMATAMVGRLVGVAAAYVGLNAGIQTFKSLTSEAINYTSELEATKIGLQAVLQAVQGGEWVEAGKVAEGAFEGLKRAAIESPATTAQMFSIYQGIVGPIASAGFELQKVHDVTVATTLAASALHVDFAQASRDVSAIVRGAAGVDVKLFSMLRSTNAIKENAEVWNKLSQKDRVEKLATALAKYKDAGEAFGKSWQGVTSTFQDVRMEMARAFTTPILQMFAGKLGAVNDYFIANQASLMNRFETYGERFASVLGRVWDRGADAAKYVVSHWGEITRRIDDAMLKFHAWAPKLLQAAKIYAGVSIGSSIAGNVLIAGAGAANLANTGLGLAGGLGGLLGMKGLFAAGTAGAGAAAAGTAAVGAGTATAGAGIGAAALGGEAIAGTVGAGAAAAAALPAVALGLAAVALAAPVVVTEWDTMAAGMKGITGDMWGQIIELGQTAWAVIRPVVLTFGNVIAMAVWALGTSLVTGLRVLTNAAQWALDTVRPFSDWLTGEFVPAIHRWWKELEKFSWILGSALNKRVTNQASGAFQDQPTKYADWGETPAQMTSILEGMNAVKEIDKQAKQKKQITSVTNDFRGSRIAIEQKFDGDQDPDRVVMAMMSDLTKQAEMRLSSGYANAFTR